MTKTRIGLSFSQDDLERLRALQEVLNTRNRSETVSVAVQMTLALRTDPVGSLAAAGVHFETPVSIEIRKDPHQVVVRCPQGGTDEHHPKP